MIITYTGKEQCDILFYLVGVGLKQGKKIAVFDNSITHDYFRLFDAEENKDFAERENLVVFCDYEYSREDCKNLYDYVFIYDGLYPTYKGFEDLSILAPTYAKAEWDVIKPKIEKDIENKTKNILILREKANRKISDYAALKLLGIDPTYMTSLEVDTKDYSSYICLTQNKKSKIQTKGELYECVVSLCEEIYLIGAKEIKKML